MASILDLLKTPICDDLIKKSVEATDENENTVSTILSMLLPLSLGNFKNDLLEGHRETLNEMLLQTPNPYKFLRILNTKSIDDIIACGKDYEEIILGKKFQKITGTIVTAAETTVENVKTITKIAMPVLVAILSIAKKENNIQKNELESLLDSALGISSTYSNSLNAIFFNQNDDPNIINDPATAVIGQKTTTKKSSILKGYTGGK